MISLDPRMMAVIGVIFVVMILNLFYFLRRARYSGSRKKGRGREYVPPDEAKRAEWRDKEVARRVAREQEDAYERVMLRNETLSYYEYVRRKYEKKEALERLGIKVDEAELENMHEIPAQEQQYMDVRDDIYLYEDPKKE